MLYLIVQSKWRRGSSQNGENLIATSTRKREARGLLKQNFNSHMEVLIEHKYHYDFDEYDFDEENYRLSLADDEGIAYSIRFYIIELAESR